ncbi:MAG TPA: hypothetical protein VK188_12655, partial [Holophaga sp.]|nr:hypothetical protein [Holophaga sp.]
ADTVEGAEPSRLAGFREALRALEAPAPADARAAWVAAQVDLALNELDAMLGVAPTPPAEAGG